MSEIVENLVFLFYKVYPEVVYIVINKYYKVLYSISANNRYRDNISIDKL